MTIESGPTPPSEQVLFGLPLAAINRHQAVCECQRAIHERRSLLLGMVNAAKIVRMRQDRHLAASLEACSLILADGQSVVWASRLLGRPLPERVTGIDLFEELMALADAEQLRVYLLGARPHVLDGVRAEATIRWPNAQIVGFHHGYFSTWEDPRIADDIIAAEPDMLFLGMTSPRKENFIATYGPELNVPIIHGVGGTFDIVAGVTKRAPVRWQRSGMEWAYRVLQEPRRLGPRYLATNLAFMRLVAGEYARARSGRTPRTG